MINTSVSATMMEKALDGLWQRGQVTLNNIANEDTPGYKAKRVAFEGLLRKEMHARTNITALGSGRTLEDLYKVRPQEYQERGTEMRADGNNVDIDAENIELARIQIQYNALVQKVSGHYSTLRYAITGR